MLPHKFKIIPFIQNSTFLKPLKQLNYTIQNLGNYLNITIPIPASKIYYLSPSLEIPQEAQAAMKLRSHKLN